MADALQNLTVKQERAALLVAEDELADEVIAAAVGISRETLHQWKKRDPFKARVAEHVEAFRDRALTEGFADKRERLRVLNLLATGTLAELAKEGGFFREEVKIAANGEHISYQVFDKPKHDTLRSYLDDIAKELGDRKTVSETTHKFDPRKDAEAIAAEIGKADDPAVVAQIERDLLISQEAR